MQEVMLGSAGSSVTHESMRPPYVGRSLCGMVLNEMHAGPVSEVTCARCQHSRALRQIQTEEIDA